MNPADLTLSISPSLTSKPAINTLSLATKGPAGKTPVPRIDLEPIYTQLKSALGEQWSDYKTAINQFVLGNLNQAELSWVLQPLLSAAPSVLANGSASGVGVAPLVSTLTLHNTLLTAIYANTLRDPPPTDVAPWVVATDKPSSTSKTSGAGSGANDKVEERLKKEVMAIHARDRRRIKALKDGGKPISDPYAEMQDYRHELAVKPPTPAPDTITPQTAAAAGTGSSVTSAKQISPLEIRRRYAQPLAGETLEFPTLSSLQERIEPLCYELGLSSGVGAAGSLQACAEVMEQATEVFLKELLGAMFETSRSNGEGEISTGRFKKARRKEEDEVERGILARNAGGALPVEVEVGGKREPLSVDDLRLAVMLGDSFMKQDPFLSRNVLLQRQPELQESAAKPRVNGIFAKPTINGTLTNNERANFDDAVIDGDADSWNWRGASKSDVNDLMNVLDDCLAVG